MLVHRSAAQRLHGTLSAACVTGGTRRDGPARHGLGVKALGRWRGTLAFIYQRVAMAASMDVAARMMGVEVEAVFSHWAQPAA